MTSFMNVFGKIEIILLNEIIYFFVLTSSTKAPNNKKKIKPTNINHKNRINIERRLSGDTKHLNLIFNLKIKSNQCRTTLCVVSLYFKFHFTLF